MEAAGLHVRFGLRNASLLIIGGSHFGNGSNVLQVCCSKHADWEPEQEWEIVAIRKSISDRRELAYAVRVFSVLQWNR
jgi:hypothetical protein